MKKQIIRKRRVGKASEIKLRESKEDNKTAGLEGRREGERG